MTEKISRAVRERAWAKAKRIEGENPDEVRMHKASGITMKRASFGKMRNFGWTVVEGKAVPCRKEFLKPQTEDQATDPASENNAIADKEEANSENEKKS